MSLTARASKIYEQIKGVDTKLGDLRKIAKPIKKDNELAMELWSTETLSARLLAVLIMDKKQLDAIILSQLLEEMDAHTIDEKLQLADWFMANQLMKDKKMVSLLMTWEKSPQPLKRRIYWYYQARLRWTGKIPIDNGEELLSAISENMEQEMPEVQWAMNYAAGQIGIFEAKFRKEVVQLGKQIGLYKDEVVAKGCTPSYLPEFVRIQVDKIKA